VLFSFLGKAIWNRECRIGASSTSAIINNDTPPHIPTSLWNVGVVRDACGLLMHILELDAEGGAAMAQKVTDEEG